MLVDFDDGREQKASVAKFADALGQFHANFSKHDVESAVQPFGWKGAIGQFEQAYLDALEPMSCQ
jgi:hypothetical protein